MTESNPKKNKRNTKKLPVEVTKEELADLLPHVKTFHHRLGIALAWECGMRISDVTKLKPKEVDIEEKRIRINDGKGGKDRVVPLPPWFTEGHLQFLPIPCGNRSLQKGFENACKKSGLKEKKPTVHFHSLRHGFITHGLRNDAKLHNMSILAGHSNIATTMMYNRLAPEEALNDWYKHR